MDRHYSATQLFSVVEHLSQAHGASVSLRERTAAIEAAFSLSTTSLRTRLADLLTLVDRIQVPANDSDSFALVIDYKLHK